MPEIKEKHVSLSGSLSHPQGKYHTIFFGLTPELVTAWHGWRAPKPAAKGNHSLPNTFSSHLGTLFFFCRDEMRVAIPSSPPFDSVRWVMRVVYWYLFTKTLSRCRLKNSFEIVLLYNINNGGCSNYSLALFEHLNLCPGIVILIFNCNFHMLPKISPQCRWVTVGSKILSWMLVMLVRIIMPPQCLTHCRRVGAWE